MYRIFLLGVLCSLGGLVAGCQNLTGPARRGPPVRVDDPRLSIDEQQRLGRDRLALPEESPLLAPPSGAARPGQPTLR